MSKTRFNDESNCICLCGLKFPEKKEDNILYSDHLNNWELWMQRRKRIHKILGKLGRGPGDLLMNLGEEYRSVKEDKLMLGYTKINNHFDKLRGNPAFWKLPSFLKSRIYPFGPTEYFAVKSREELNEIPDIEYVGTPNYVLIEKDLVPRNRNLYTLWKNRKSYRDKIIQRMSSKILEIEPHRPDFQNLVLIGEKIKPETPKDLYLLRINKVNKIVPYVLNSEKFSENDVADTSSRLSLKINNLTFDEGYSIHYHNKISIIFEYFMDARLQCQQSLLFENTGQTVLRLYWTPYHKLKIFREYRMDSKIFHPFKFSRNEMLLLPGQKINFTITFQASKPGNYFESWELTTNPVIWSQDYHLVIVFKGFALMQQYEEKTNILLQNLDQRIKNTVVKDLVNDIISKGNYCAQAITTSHDFSEKELFESVNLKKSICLQTPKYVYNKNIISELKDLYQEIREPNDAEVWNFSIRKLQGMCRKKDLFLYFENNILVYTTAKSQRTMLQGNITENQNTQEKFEKVTMGKPMGKARKDLPTNEVMDCPTPTLSYYSKLKDITQKLEKPSIVVNIYRTKYVFCCLIIRTYIFKMFDQLYMLGDKTCNMDDIENQIRPSRNIEVNTPKSNTNQQIQYFQDKFGYEKFDESYILRTKRISSESAFRSAKPKSTLLNGISAADVKRIYKLYYNKEEGNEKQNKKSGRKDDISKKIIQKSGKSKNSSQVEKDLFLNVMEDFDPFLEKVPVDLGNVTKSNIKLNLDIKDPKEIKNYEEKYLIVYTGLCNAIDDLTETVDNFTSQNILYDTLRELQPSITLRSKSDQTKLTEKSVTLTSNRECMKTQSAIDKDEYYRFLLETHWKNNIKIKKYFIQEKKQTISDSKKPEHYKVKDVGETLSNIFSLETFQRKPDPPGIKDKNMQTNSIDLKVSSQSNYEREPSIHEISVKERSFSKNIFYFLDNTCEPQGTVLSNEK